MHAVPIARIEQLLTQHLPTHDAAGPIRQTASRTHDVITTVIDIAHHLHPEADLTHLSGLLPTQLELGIPPDLIPLATHARNALGRPHYLSLLAANLAAPHVILDATDQHLLDCLGSSHTRLHILREAAEHALATQTAPDFADVLPAASD
jgi:helicase